MPVSAALEALLHASAAVPPWPTADVLVPVLAVAAGLGGTWLHAVHPPAAAYGHEPALVALTVV